jgi:hypothetical protein
MRTIDTELEAVYDDRTRKNNKVGSLQAEAGRLDKAISNHNIAITKREQLEKDIKTIEADEKELNEKVTVCASLHCVSLDLSSSTTSISAAGQEVCKGGTRPARGA